MIMEVDVPHCFCRGFHGHLRLRGHAIHVTMDSIGELLFVFSPGERNTWLPVVCSASGKDSETLVSGYVKSDGLQPTGDGLQPIEDP